MITIQRQTSPVEAVGSGVKAFGELAVSNRKHLSDCRVVILGNERIDVSWPDTLSRALSGKCRNATTLDISDRTKSPARETDIVIFTFYKDFERRIVDLASEFRHTNPDIRIVLITGLLSGVEEGTFDLVLSKTRYESGEELVASLNKMLCNEPLGAKGAAKDAAKATVSAKKINKVLVVDDDSQWLGILSRAVRESGREFKTASDKASALALLASESFDLVITDRSKGGVHYGDEIALEAKKLGIPCVMVSGGELTPEERRSLNSKLGLYASFNKGDVEPDFIPEFIAGLEAGK